MRNLSLSSQNVQSRFFEVEKWQLTWFVLQWLNFCRQFCGKQQQSLSQTGIVKSGSKVFESVGPEIGNKKIEAKVTLCQGVEIDCFASPKEY